ncbi:MAG TPA: BlaI/MecI/CopY family transcriptional regulator [Gemmatimonadaceae bacterium]
METSLGERELDVMGILWRTGPGGVAEVRERLRDRLDVELAYNTVLTILRNLEAKGFVGHTAEGRSHRYHPAVSERTVRASTLSRVADKLFRGSPLSMVAHLVEHQALTADELRTLHDLLDERLDERLGASDKPRGARTKRHTTPRKP